MSRTLKTLITAGLLAVTLSGCIVAPPRPHPRRPPPPVEVVPVMPAAGYHWVPGHYQWAREQWVWMPGHWRY